MREGALCGILVLVAACGDDGPSRREIVDLMLEYHSDESIYEGLTSADATRRGWIQEARALYAPLPDSSEKGVAYLRIARIHRQLGEREEAQDALAQASPLLDGEDLGRCEFERGRFLREQGLSKEAEAALRGALNLAHDVAAHHDELGVLLLSIDRPKEAEEAQRTARTILDRTDDQRGLARNLRNQGFLLRATGRADEAEKALRQSLEIRTKLAAGRPKSPLFRYELAQAYHDVGIVSKGDEAVAAYRKALEIAKELPAGVPPFQEQLAAAHLSLAAHLMFRNRRAAGPHLRRAGELQAELVDDFPNRPAYRRKLGLILANVAMERAANGINSAEEWANVIAFQEGLVEDYPERSIFHNDLGATLSIRAQFLARSEERAAGTVALLERAVAENRIALEAMPRHPRYRRLLGHCQALLAREFLGRGDPRRAAEAAAAAARVEPDRWETQDHAASLLEDCIEATPNDSTRTRRYAEQAVACYERALDLAPDNAVRYRNFANFLVKGAEVSARDPRRALELTRKGLDLDPESGNLHLLRGIALVQSMRHEEALDALEKAEFGVTPYWTAQAHWHLGDKEKARAAYEEGTKLSPDDEMEALRVKTAALLGIK